MKIDAQEYRDRCLEGEDWTKGDSRELSNFLSTKFGQKVICYLLWTAGNKVNAAGMSDLSTSEGVMMAIRLQGQGQGIDLIVDALIDMVNAAEDLGEAGEAYV
jgi:hypothetical protein